MRAARQRVAAGLRQTRDWGERQNIALALRWFAALAAVQAQSTRAMLLVAAATALDEAINSRVFPLQERLFERWLAPTREARDPTARAETEAAGRAMTLEQAIAYAFPTRWLILQPHFLSPPLVATRQGSSAMTFRSLGQPSAVAELRL